MQTTTQTAAVLFIAMVSFILLYLGQSLLIPFILALLTWFLIRELIRLLEKIGFVKRHIPRWIISTFVILVIFGLLGLVGQTLSYNIQNLVKSYSLYEKNLEKIGEELNGLFKINLTEYLKSFFGSLRFGEILARVLSSISGLLGSAFLIFIYVIFIFAEESFFRPKLHAIFPDQGRYARISSLADRIGHSIRHYVGLKSLMSLITAAASYCILWLIGIDAPAFWAFLIFLLNFIPNIGSLIATAFPAIFALLQFGQLWPFILVLVLITAVQLLVGNFLEPRVMGKSLNISPLVTILALSFWGLLWGVTGMLLSVPITVIMVIIFAQFENTRPIAILLSQTGEVTGYTARAKK